MTRHQRAGAVGRWLALAAFLALCLAGGLFASVDHAAAHASLVRAEPADGAVIPAAPAQFTLVFSEPTSPLVLKLIRPDGSSTMLDRFVLRDKTLIIEAPGDIGHGTHVLSWRIVSEDGHPVGGSAIFSIGAPGSTAVPAEEPVDWQVRGLIWVSRVLLYIGLFLGCGGSFIINWIGGRSLLVQRITLLSLFGGLAAVPLAVGLQGLDALGLSLSNIARGQVWSAALSTSYAQTAMLAIVALLSAMAALYPRRRGSKTLAVFGLLATGLALAASGHASTADPQWLTRPAVFLHAVGIAFWSGALIPLMLALKSSPTSAGNIVLRRFSNAAPWAVLPLIVAGVLLVVVQLRGSGAPWTTAYGQVLMVKLALLGVLFALAALNRFRLTAPVLHGDAKASTRLRATIRVELILVLAIFGVAATWRFTPPPRALAATASSPATAHIHTDKLMADVTLTPGRVGPTKASISILDGEFAPLDPQEVTLVLANPTAGIEPVRRPATRSADGGWHIESLNLPVPGRWTIRIDVLISDFELAKIEDTIEIRP